MERQRDGRVRGDATTPLQSFLLHTYRRHVWLRDPLSHNALLDRLLLQSRDLGPWDWAVANGDFACNSTYQGMADDAAFEGASLALGRLRGEFGDRLLATFGDHEIGKQSMTGGYGGMRLESYRRACDGLSLEPFWVRTTGRWVLMGVASPLVAFPVFEPESLPAERAEWEALRADQMRAVADAFRRLEPSQRVVLFCHDPTALPFLHAIPEVRSRLNQVSQTVIGHLHSPFVHWHSRLLAGMPQLDFLGTTVRRFSSALNRARCWAPFRVRLCPSLTGIELRQDGGFLTVELPDESLPDPPRWTFHPLRWVERVVPR